MEPVLAWGLLTGGAILPYGWPWGRGSLRGAVLSHTLFVMVVLCL